MAKIKKYSEEELKELNTKALDMIDTIKVSRGRKSESADFLLSIKEVIKKALDKEIPFTHINKLVKDLYSVDVSVNILKSFAKKELDYEPKKRAGANAVVKKIKASASVEDKVDMSKMSVAEMKKATADSSDELDDMM